MAKINPKRLSGCLKRQECNALSEAIKEVLQQSIQNGGSTLRDFTHSDGSHGYFQQYYRVYGKENAPCSICGTLIERMVQNQRSTFFCPNCQK